MNFARLNPFSFLRGFSSYKFSPRRAFLSFTGTTIIVSFLYPQTRTKFELYHQDTEENQRRISQCPSIHQGHYFPTPYLAYGTLQAIYAGHSVYCDPNVKFTPETIDVPGGGKIGMHWGTYIDKRVVDEKKAVMIVLPGLTASSREPYVKNIVAEALENGYEVVVYHNRGNEVEMTLPDSGFFEPIDDFKVAVDYVRKKYPEHQLFAVGHSFGANTLVNYLGKYKEETPIKAAASIANPFDFVKAANGLVNTMFDKYLAESLQVWAERNKDILSKAPKHFNIDWEKAMSTKSMVDFDEFLTRRMLGYKNFLEYYAAISSVKALKDVSIPLLCMHSRDDPFLHETSIPIEESLNNKNVTLLVTNNGGHVGWFHGIWQPKRWFPKPTVEFINACQKEMNQNNQVLSCH